MEKRLPTSGAWVKVPVEQCGMVVSFCATINPTYTLIAMFPGCPVKSVTCRTTGRTPSHPLQCMNFYFYFPGYFTNHSLRASCASRLFHAGVDEQFICKTTGHRSKAVCIYKRPHSEQEVAISEISKRPCVEDQPRTSGAISTSKEASSNQSFNFSFNINTKN